MGPQGLEFGNPLGFLFPTWNRRLEVWELGKLGAARFERIEYPVLMHCKSGADRAGLMSVLYLHFVERRPIEEARHQLAARFGHFRSADTGILDFVFERYLRDTARAPMPFLDWVETAYDPVALKQEFRSKGWANRLVDGLLRRE